MRKIQALGIISIIILTNVIFLPTYFSPAFVHAQGSSNPTNSSQPTANSQESTLDSFDVNPNSGRWSTSTTGNVHSQIQSSNLALQVTDQGASSSYLMTRPLATSSGKIEYRMNNSLSTTTNTLFNQYQGALPSGLTNPTSIATTNNILQDPGFESASGTAHDWLNGGMNPACDSYSRVTSPTIPPHSGSYSLLISQATTTSTCGIVNNVATLPFTEYVFGIWMYFTAWSDPTNDFVEFYYHGPSGYAAADIVAPGAGVTISTWVHYTVTFVTASAGIKDLNYGQTNSTAQIGITFEHYGGYSIAFTCALDDLTLTRIGATSTLSLNSDNSINVPVTTVSSSNTVNLNLASLSLISNSYTTMTIVAQANTNIEMYLSSASDALMSNQLILIAGSYTSLTFTLNTAWTGTINNFNIVFWNYNNAYQILATSYIFKIQSITLYGSNVPQKVLNSFSFQNPSTNALDVNVTQFFYTSTEFNWKISFSDSNNNIVASYNSSIFNTTNNYYRIKVSYDIQLAQFSVEIDNDSYSKLLTINYPGDFSIKGLPDFFSIQSAPNIAFYALTNSTGTQNDFLDYINANFAQNWNHMTLPSHALISDSPFTVTDNVETGSVTEVSTVWSQNIPRFDSFSGTFTLNSSKNTLACTDVCDIKAYINLFVVDQYSGHANLLFSIFSEFFTSASPNVAEGVVSLMDNNNNLVGSYIEGASNANRNAMNSQASFTLTTSNNRQLATASLQGSVGTQGVQGYSAGSSSFSINTNSVDTHPSQEFIVTITTETIIDGSGGTGSIYMTALFTSLSIQTNDWLSNLFGGVNNFIGGIVSTIGTIIVTIFGPLMKWLGNALILTLTTVVSYLGSFLSPIFSTIDNVFNWLLSFIASFLGQFLTWIGTNITNLWNDIVTIIALIESFVVNVVIGWINGAGLGPIFTQIVNAATTFINGLLYLFTQIVNMINYLTSHPVLTINFLLTIVWIWLLLLPALFVNSTAEYVDVIVKRSLTNLLPDSEVLGFSIYLPLIVVLFIVTYTALQIA